MNFIEVVRQFKVGPFAVFDVAISYVGVFLIAPLLTNLALKVHLRVSRQQWLWLVLPVSVLVHVIFGQETPLTKMIVEPNGYYLVKLVILFMLFMGLKDTRIAKK